MARRAGARKPGGCGGVTQAASAGRTEARRLQRLGASGIGRAREEAVAAWRRGPPLVDLVPHGRNWPPAGFSGQARGGCTVRGGCNGSWRQGEATAEGRGDSFFSLILSFSDPNCIDGSDVRRCLSSYLMISRQRGASVVAAR
uniref:Uncharacterized protein n=1 Tax=Leersia perrieri TaxID=77586 RepID=A0A0D9XQT6_9ORYZ